MKHLLTSEWGHPHRETQQQFSLHVWPFQRQTIKRQSSPSSPQQTQTTEKKSPSYIRHPVDAGLSKGNLALAMANYLLSIAHLANQEFVTLFFQRNVQSLYVYIK